MPKAQRTPRAKPKKSHPGTYYQKPGTLNVSAQAEFAKLGNGQVAFIRTMTSKEARKAFPAVTGLPRGITLYALHGADGSPLALTDTMSAAISHAIGDELQIATLH